MPVVFHCGRTLRPHGADQVQPAFEPFAELARPGIVRAAELINEPKISKQRHSFTPLRHEAPVRKPHKQIESSRRTGERLCSLHVGWDRMAHDLIEEFVAEDDFVLKSAGKCCLICVTRVPNPRLAHKVETRPMHNRGPVSLHVGAEENRRAEYALERSHQSSVLCPALLHPEGFKHLGRASELNRLALLADCQRCQEDRNESVLSPVESV